MPSSQGHSAQRYLSDHAGEPLLIMSPPLNTSPPLFLALEVADRTSEAALIVGPLRIERRCVRVIVGKMQQRHRHIALARCGGKRKCSEYEKCGQETSDRCCSHGRKGYRFVREQCGRTGDEPKKRKAHG